MIFNQHQGGTVPGVSAGSGQIVPGNSQQGFQNITWHGGGGQWQGGNGFRGGGWNGGNQWQGPGGQWQGSRGSWQDPGQWQGSVGWPQRPTGFGQVPIPPNPAAGLIGPGAGWPVRGANSGRVPIPPNPAASMYVPLGGPVLTYGSALNPPAPPGIPPASSGSGAGVPRFGFSPELTDTTSKLNPAQQARKKKLLEQLYEQLRRSQGVGLGIGNGIGRGIGGVGRGPGTGFGGFSGRWSATAPPGADVYGSVGPDYNSGTGTVITGPVSVGVTQH